MVETLLENLNNWLHGTLIFLAAMLIIGLLVLSGYVVVSYFIDITQTRHAIRRNYPVIGRFRYFFEHVGEFFRQYFFAMDREELPFNRAQRSWVYRAAKGVDSTVPFGSTRDIRKPGSVLFVNSPYPTLGEDSVPAQPITFGQDCPHPYTTNSFFNISGMSYGALSAAAVTALSHGANDAGIWINTGEGGLSQFHLSGHCDIVFQIGTAKNGVRDLDGKLNDEKLSEIAAHPEVKMFEIKLSQGAKPGKGGILPAEKVTEEIAGIRGIEAGKAAISPNRHYDVKCDDDLLNLIKRVRDVTGKPTGFKAVIGSALWIDQLCQLILQKGLEYAPDFITIDGAEGGTGAAPMALMDDMGLPLRESLPLVIDMLKEYGLFGRVRVLASGKLVTPTDVAWALCLGVDGINSARGFMFALGCIQAMQCNKNTCPTGITTHNLKLQRGLEPMEKSKRVASYARHMVYEVGLIAHACGVKQPRELGREHARMMGENGISTPLYELHPDVKLKNSKT